MKVYINRKPINGPWGGGNHFVRASYKFFKENDIEVIPSDCHTEAPDSMLIVGLDNDGTGISLEQAIMYKLTMSHIRDIKLILRVNENDARKATNIIDKNLVKFSSHIDATIFVSNWLQDYFMKKGWACQNNSVIVNGVDSTVFKPSQKRNDGKINIVCAHWSDNHLKGQDEYEWLNSFVNKNKNEYTFTFIGRTKANLNNSTHVRPLFGLKLGEELAKYDVCINSSRFDPGPNSVIESISCDLPTYVHADGGGAVEFAGQDHVFSNIQELEQLLLSKKFQSNTAQFLPWKDVIQQYSKTIKSII